MDRIRRAGIAGLIAVVVATSCAALLPATPAAAVATPTIRLFSGETLATNAEGSAQGSLNRLRATIVINHPPGVTVSQMRRKTGQHASFTAWGAVEGTVRTIPGVSGNYSVVEAVWVPGTSSWGGCFTSSVRWCDRTAEVGIRMSDGTELAGSWTYRAQTEVQSSGQADPPTMYNNYDTTVNANFNAAIGNTLRLHYVCDDNDGSGGSDDECDNVAIRVRNITNGETYVMRCDQSTVNCENGVKFNADDGSERNGTIPVPEMGRGRYVIEGMFCNEDQRSATTLDCSGRGSGWQWMGSYNLNMGAPQVGFYDSSFAGGGTTVGGVLRPNTDASVAYRALGSGNLQVALWDVNDDGTTDQVELGESGDLGTAPVLDQAFQLVRIRSTTGLPEGSSCAVRVQVRDNGALNAADPTSLLSSQVSSQPCTVNRRPTGASQSGLTATKGVPLSIPLANADGDSDPRTCELVGPATTGSVTLAGCTATFTAAPDTAGPASFQYRVLDDHAGISPTYTIALTVQNRPPTSVDQAVTVPAGDSAVITLGGSDPDGDATTCAVTAPTGGSLSSGSGCTRAYVAPATAGTHTFTYTRTDSLGASSPAATVTVTVEPVVEPGVRGRVTADATGDGIAGVTVRLYRDGVGFTAHTAVTDADGDYDLGAAVPAGTYRVVFKDPDQDFVDEWWSDSPTRSASTPVVVAADAEVRLDAGLATGAELTVDIANPGSFTVALYNADPSTSSAYRSIPNVSGTTTFRGLPAGTYYVSVSDPAALLAQTWSGSQTDRGAAVGIPIATGEDVTRTFTLPTRRTISGEVFDAEGPVGSVTVQAYTASGGTFVKSTKTDGEGRYVLRDLAPGGYKLIFRDTSGAHPLVWSGGAEAINSAVTYVMTGDGAVIADEELPMPVTITGTVTGGPGGTTPLAEAKVTLYRNGSAVRTYTTDAQGGFRAEGLAAGSYTALFAAAGHRSEYHADRYRKADADIVAVVAGDEITLDSALAPT